MTREERNLLLKNAGINIEYFESTGKLVFDGDEIENQIENNGFIFNRFVDRRFIPAQVFHMLSHGNRYEDGFNNELNRKGYGYQWKVLKNELHTLSKMEQNPDETFRIRSTFFNATVVASMFCDYKVKLKRYINTLPVKHCRRQPYKTIGRFGNVFVVDIKSKILDVIEFIYKELIRRSNDITFKELYDCVNTFINCHYVKLPYNTLMSGEFKSAYKGAGAYYTLDSMIKYHGCMMPHCTTQRESLDVLEKCRKERQSEYYQMFGLLKEVIKYNNDFNLFRSIAGNGNRYTDFHF